MVGNDQKVQWSNKLHRLAGVRYDLFTARHFEAVVRIERGADQARVERKLRVKVHVAKEHLVRIRPAHVRRIDTLLRVVPVVCEILGGDRSLRHLGAQGGSGCQQQADG